MKFLKENWYKLMTGSAMLIFACGFFIYAVGPSYANKASSINQYEDGREAISVVHNGYLYTWSSKKEMWEWGTGKNGVDSYDDGFVKPYKRKLRE